VLKIGVWFKSIVYYLEKMLYLKAHQCLKWPSNSSLLIPQLFVHYSITRWRCIIIVHKYVNKVYNINDVYILFKRGFFNNLLQSDLHIITKLVTLPTGDCKEVW